MGKQLSRAQKALVQYRTTQFLNDHLIDLARALDGDLQLALLLSVIDQRLLQRVVHPSDGDPENSDRSISASRLAEITGLPRQTVRRKLITATQRGWLEQTDTRAWRSVVDNGHMPMRDALTGVYERGITRGLRFASELKPFTE